jgi:hypothetical protein
VVGKALPITVIWVFGLASVGEEVRHFITFWVEIRLEGDCERRTVKVQG